MAKARSVYFCQNCGYESAKWIGKCPSCNEWNTFVEEIVQKQASSGWSPVKLANGGQKLKKIDEISFENQARIPTHDPESGRVLGGGIVLPASCWLAANLGIGQTTPMLQEALAIKGRKVLYVSGEESHQQIKMRADRLGITNGDCFVLSETELGQILGYAIDMQPDYSNRFHTNTLHRKAGRFAEFLASRSGNVPAPFSGLQRKARSALLSLATSPKTAQ